MPKNARRAGMVVAVVSLLCLGANNPFKFSSVSKKELAERVEFLERQNAELRKQVEDLSMKVELLSQRVNTMYASAGRRSSRPGPAAVAGGSQVSGLDVVRLSPGDARPEKKKGRLIIAHSDGDSTTLIEHKSSLPGTDYVPLPDPENTIAKHGSGANTPETGDSLARPALSESDVEEPGTGEAVKGSKQAGPSFEKIKKLVKDGEAAKATPMMESYLGRKGGEREDQVAFWLGQYYYERGEYEKAIKAYRVVSERHVQSLDAPEALYKTGLCLLELDRIEDAADALREVKILYPFSSFAEEAEDKLVSCCR